MSSIDQLKEQLVSLLGEAGVVDDITERQFYSQDIYSAGELVSLVIKPTSTEDLSKAVKLVADAGMAIAPRGGGMSYTNGYTQTAHDVVLVDMGGMNKVIEINPDDMYITVQCGCTWAEVHEALEDTGLRTPFWGTLSGIQATVGGGLSQNGMFFGSAQYGPVTESVVGLKVVLADGSIVPTGTWSTTGAQPFNRHYGPDLTGLFVADTGALAIKAEASFRLIRQPAHVDYASFSFETYDACAEALCAVARLGVASEIFGFDPDLAEKRLQRESLMKDLQSLSGVLKGQSGVLDGVKEAAKVAVAGRRYMKDVSYSMHVAVEGSNRPGVEADIATVREVATRWGKEIENSIPKITRGAPFNPLNNVLGPEGERWLPIHGMVPLSQAKAVWAAIYQLIDQYQDRFDRLGITKGFLVSTLSNNAFLIEPVLYWPSSHGEIHRRTIQENVMKGLKGFEKNDEADAVVAEFKLALCELFLEFKAAHFQIGRAYLYKQGRDEHTWRVLEGIKDVVDSGRRLNPGSLGLK